MAKIGVIHYNFPDFDFEQFLRFCVDTGYGYAELSVFARKIESAFQTHSADQFADWMAQFAKLIAAARSGLRPEQPSGA